MGKITKIVIHCSDSEFGTALLVNQWHKARGWDRIGYMGVILNGSLNPTTYWEESDGAWEWGRPLNHDNEITPTEKEAHAFGINSTSVGICLIGTNSFTLRQYYAVKKWVKTLCAKWGVPISDVVGHYEVDDAGKTCPNIDMKVFRKFLLDDNAIAGLKIKATK